MGGSIVEVCVLEVVVLCSVVLLGKAVDRCRKPLHYYNFLLMPNPTTICILSLLKCSYINYNT